MLHFIHYILFPYFYEIFSFASSFRCSFLSHADYDDLYRLRALMPAFDDAGYFQQVLRRGQVGHARVNGAFLRALRR